MGLGKLSWPITYRVLSVMDRLLSRIVGLVLKPGKCDPITPGSGIRAYYGTYFGGVLPSGPLSGLALISDYCPGKGQDKEPCSGLVPSLRCRR
jgi:hypothetical protein